MKYIIGMDVGTTATKGVLYDEKGKAVFSASKGYPLIQTKIGQAEEDPKMIFDAVQEIIFAVRPSIEGETTTLYISKLLEGENIIISKIAHGVPLGADMDYIDALTLEMALEDRKKISDA